MPEYVVTIYTPGNEIVGDEIRFESENDQSALEYLTQKYGKDRFSDVCHVSYRRIKE